MKRIINTIVFALAMLASTSCVEPLDNSLPRQDLTINFYCGVMTKAPDLVNGVDNENLVKKIDYFIFPVNLDEDNNMVGSTECVYHNQYVPTNGLAADFTYTVVIEHSELIKMFPDGANSMMLFAVANYVDVSGSEADIPTKMPDSDDPITWEALHSLEVGPTFYKDGGPGYGLRWPLPMDPSDDGLFFVMTGEKEIELKTVSQDIPLERLASKVTVQFDYVEKVVDDRGTPDDTSDDITWIPQCTDHEIRAYLSNAVAHASLGGALDFREEYKTRDLVGDSWGTLNNGTRDVFEFAYNYFNPVTSSSTTPPTVAEVEAKVFHYYTYPISLDAGDDNQPYIKLVMRWFGYKRYVDSDNPGALFKQKEVYYKIVLPRNGIIDPNRIYEYKVVVDIVDNEKDVLIQGEYKVKDWLSKSEMSANVAAGRYISLDIPKDEYDMYVDKFDIAFVSSGTVIRYVDSIYQFNYSSASQVTKDIFMLNNAVPNTTATNNLLTRKGVTRDQVAGWVTIPDETSYVEINHVMDNRILIDGSKNNAFDMAPYVFVVRLHLEEDETGSFDRTIRITQYPAMFVTSRRSNGYTFVNGYSNTGSGNHICYDDRGTSSNEYRLGNIRNTPGSLNGSGDNSNPNNYIISTSILSGLDYVIGDPRLQTVDNLSNLGPRTGVVEKGLTNYHPTDPSGSENMIAPKILVASSYGAITEGYYMTLEAATKRCAAYQENGYPAGRWRVPTAGEIIYMVKLSEFGFIPSLFQFYGGNGGGNSNQDYEGYWSANGKIIGVRANGSSPFEPSLNTNYNGIITAVRCVYDAWYWGEEPYEEDATNWLDYKD